jgi:hypothetical protein
MDDLDEQSTRNFLNCLIPRNCVVVRSSQKFKTPPLSSSSQNDDGSTSATSASETTNSAATTSDSEKKKVNDNNNDDAEYVLNLVEKWYGVNYGCEPLSEKLSNYWTQNLTVDQSSSSSSSSSEVVVPTSLSDKLSLPPLNPYIPDNLTLFATDEERTNAKQRRDALFAMRGNGELGQNNGEGEADDVNDGEYGCSCQDILNQILSTRSSENQNQNTTNPAAEGQPPMKDTATTTTTSLTIPLTTKKCVVHPPDPSVPGAFSVKVFRDNIAKEKANTNNSSKKNMNMKMKSLQYMQSEFIEPPTLLLQGDSGSSSSSSSLWWDLWHKLDASYNVPKAYISVKLISPIAVSDPVHTSLLIRMYTHAVQQR